METVKDYREFTTKAKIRLIIFVILWLISYLVCTISLFFWKWFIVPAISFIILFLLIYFIALDCYKIKFAYVLLALFWIFLFETISFIILLWFSWYLLAELVLFNVAIWTLLFLLDWQLDHRTWFAPLSYFTEWWFFVTTLLTVFFCVLMMWKYTQIPFTCDDIENFPTKIAETTANPLKNTRNKIVSRFKEDEEETLNMPDFYAIWNPLSKSTDLASADAVEWFFTNIRNTIEDQTVWITNQVSKSTCKQYIKILQKTQKSEWIQIAWIVIGYLLLVWVFKILLWVVSIFWFVLFIILRIFGVYKYEKRMVEKEVIV
jgi:hypothetical protein